MLRAALSVVYDLVVGDSWRLGAVVLAVLGAGAAIAASAALPATLLGPLIALAAFVAAPVTVIVEARAALRRN